jgi:hypothetical protein
MEFPKNRHMYCNYSCWTKYHTDLGEIHTSIHLKYNSVSEGKIVFIRKKMGSIYTKC